MRAPRRLLTRRQATRTLPLIVAAAAVAGSLCSAAIARVLMVAMVVAGALTAATIAAVATWLYAVYGGQQHIPSVADKTAVPERADAGWSWTAKTLTVTRAARPTSATRPELEGPSDD